MSRGGRLDDAGLEARRPLHAQVPPDQVVVGPVRTCVGCRATGPRSTLLRVVAAATETGAPVLVVDVRRRMPGRGAWLHPDPGCLELATRRRAFGRALRLQGAPDVTAVAEHLEHQHTTSARLRTGSPTPTVEEGSGLEADGYPMSTHR
ncbi:YlxR family protein [Cellulomonas composti]|uniref:YlxR family protein n=1 Tax=Cellulomonas composti TaxID=266130 RepID=UPI0011BDEFCE|nr:YlxR family protein [Cellulomonas composti]